MKSAMEVMRWVLAMRIILRTTIQDSTIASVGPR